jgi:hypothetical protein
MKVYLSGQMRGLEDLNFELFAEYAGKLRAEGHTVFNPASANLHGHSLEKIFAYELEWLCLQADAIAMMPGWENSRGATAERAVAIALDKQVILL